MGVWAIVRCDCGRGALQPASTKRQPHVWLSDGPQTVERGQQPSCGSRSYQTSQNFVPFLPFTRAPETTTQNKLTNWRRREDTGRWRRRERCPAIARRTRPRQSPAGKFRTGSQLLAPRRGRRRPREQRRRADRGTRRSMTRAAAARLSVRLRVAAARATTIIRRSIITRRSTTRSQAIWTPWQSPATKTSTSIERPSAWG